MQAKKNGSGNVTLLAECNNLKRRPADFDDGEEDDEEDDDDLEGEEEESEDRIEGIEKTELASDSDGEEAKSVNFTLKLRDFCL